MDTKRKAKPQGIVRRAPQRWKKALRHRLEHFKVSEKQQGLIGRYAVINPKDGSLVCAFTDEVAAREYQVEQLKALTWYEVLDRGSEFDFVPAFSKII